MIYADYNGSAPLCPEVKNYLLTRLQEGPFANPNAIHHLGQKVLMGMENARAICAKTLGATFKQVIFNSGATEGINQVFYSILDENPHKTIITSGIEHSAVVNLCRHYESKGATVKILPTSQQGIVDISQLKSWLKEGNVGLVTVMACNNETGVVQPYQEIGNLCQENNVPFLCDTTQYIGKASFRFKELPIDYAVMSGHKIGAMTGCGLLLAKDPQTLKTQIIGGGQEKGLRGGTQNYLGNETIAVALQCLEHNLKKLEELAEERTKFEATIKKEFPQVWIMGEKSPRLGGTTYISYPGIHGQAVQIELESQGIYVTTSSACSDNSPVTSKVLKAMGIEDNVGRGVVRISLGPCSNIEDYDSLATALIKAYKKLEKIKSF